MLRRAKVKSEDLFRSPTGMWTDAPTFARALARSPAIPVVLRLFLLVRSEFV